MAVPLGITTFPTYGNCPPFGTYMPRPASELTDQRIGRNVVPRPSHLSRVLYVPWHKADTLHLPLYDVSEAYEQAVGDAPIGGSDFKTRICLMKKPGGTTIDADVRFLVDFELEGRSIQVGERCLGRDPHEALV